MASWGAYLLKRDILAMSFAPRDTHEAQVQFALERGVPAMIGVMASERMPYPARAFDMAHCSRCLIPWFDFGGFTSFSILMFSSSLLPSSLIQYAHLIIIPLLIIIIIINLKAPSSPTYRHCHSEHHHQPSPYS